MGRDWSEACSRNHSPSRRYVRYRHRNGRRYQEQRCRDCDAIHKSNGALKAKLRRCGFSEGEA
jgi:hypothetical protein